jgi:hypothetical protein
MLHRKFLPPLLLAIVAFLLRAWRIGQVQYGIDESVASAIATQIAHGKYFPLTGLETSFGFHNPPAFFYLLAPLFALTRDPAVVGLAFALAGSAAVVLAWRSGLLLGGPLSGVLAATLLAVCPNAVEHSRRLWGHDLIVPCAALVAWGTIEYGRRGRWWALAIAFASAALAQTIHLSGILLWIIPLVGGLDPRNRRSWWALACGAAVLLLLYIPWLVNEARTGFAETRLIAGLLGGGRLRGDLGMPVGPLAAWTLVLSDFWTNDLLGSPRPFMLSPLAAGSSAVQGTLAILLLGTAIHFLFTRPREEQRLAWALGAGILLPAIVFGILLRAAVPPYMLPALVPAAVASAWMLGRDPMTSLRGRLGAAIICLYAASSIILTVETRQQMADGAGTSISLSEKQEIMEAVRAGANGGPFRLMQDARDAGTGVDVAYAVLLYWAGIDQLQTTKQPGVPIFVIMDPRTVPRPDRAAFLRGMPRRDFQRLSLVTIPGDRAADWLSLTASPPQ